MARPPAPPRRRLPAAADPLGRGRAEDRRRRRGVDRAPAHVGRRRRGPDLHDPVRHLPPQAPSRDRASAGEADRGRDHERPGEPHLLLPDARPRPPDLQLPGDPRLLGGGARARAAAPARDGPPQPVSVGPGRDAAGGGGPDRRRRLRGGVRAAKPRGPRVHPARAGGASGASAARGARRGGPAGRAVRARRRPRAVQPHAAPRGAGGRQGRGRLHERGPDPQRGLQLVADDRGRDPGEDRDRGAPLHGSPPRAHLAAGGPGGARGRRAPAGGDRIGRLLLVYEHEADPVGRDVALRAARDLPDARLLRHRRGLRGVPVRPGRGGAAPPGGQAPRARRLRREVLGQDRQRAPVADDLRRRGVRVRRRTRRRRMRRPTSRSCRSTPAAR